EHQYISPTEAVAEMPEDERADRARDVRDTECEKGKHQRRVVIRREEHLREDQRRSGAEHEEVVVLDRAAHEAGQRCAAWRSAGNSIGFRGCNAAHDSLSSWLWWLFSRQGGGSAWTSVRCPG